MDIQSAIDFVNKNLAAIGSAARLNNPAALDVQAAYAAMCQGVVTGNRLVLAVEEWKRYQADNPNADV